MISIIKYTSVVIAPIISNAKKQKYYYKFYILTQGISIENQIVIKDFISNYEGFSLDFIELNDIDISKFYFKDYYTVSTYFRFYIPELFRQYDRVLYLDSDIVVDADISELVDMDFENRLAIAIQDTKHCNIIKGGGEDWYSLDYFYNTLKLNNPEHYFNAGVILFNIKRMNEENISEKLFYSLSEIEKPILQDQDVLNSVLYKKNRREGIKLISNKYNYMRNIRLNPYYVSYKNLFLSRLKSLLGLDSKQEKLFYIYHFVESAKPWNSNRSDRLLFYKYLYSIHLVNPPKKFVDEIIKENNRKFPFWWRLFMKFFS